MTDVHSQTPRGIAGPRLVRTFGALFAIVILLITSNSTKAGSVTLAWNASTSSGITNYSVKYGAASGSYTGRVDVSAATTTTTVGGLANGVTFFFVVTARSTNSMESDPSNEISYRIPTSGTNARPTANALTILAREDQGTAVTLTGGDSDGDPLTFQVVNSPANGTLSGTAPNLTYTPGANYSGTDSFTFRANDGLTNSANATVSITISAVNDQPTLNSLTGLTLATNPGPQTVNLSGIGSGAANESQTLTVTANHNNSALLGSITVAYTSPATTGTLTFTPNNGASGTAVVTVTVNDGGSSNNTVIRTFNVVVGTTPNITVFIEAESGTRVSPMVVGTDANASGGQYVYTGTDEQGTVSFQLNITQPDDYYVWCRVLSAFNYTDSLYVSMDGTNEDIYETAIGTLSPNWQWTRLNGETLGNPRIFALNPGTHTLTFRGREADTFLDALHVTSDPNFVPGATPGNNPPTLNAINSLTLNEDAGAQTVTFTGITSGSISENQTLTVTASSSNTGLIPTPTVTYTSPNATGSLALTPAANASGSATITVTVNDGQSQSNTVTRTFLVTVNPVNDTPTLAAISNVTINEDAAQQTISLSGIGTGAANENQTLTVTASSSNTGRIPNPTVTYTSPNATGSLAFTPVANASGSATITVTVNDGQSQNNTVTRNFTVNINAVNDAPTLAAISNVTINEDAPQQTVSLSGISAGANESQTLTVTAFSSNTGLIPNPTVTYSSPNTTGSLAFAPVANENGSATVTVTVNDGQNQNNTVTRTFTVTVNAVNDAPTLNTLSSLLVNEDAGSQTISLSGIGSGAANESQTLSVTASSSNTGLIPTPTVTYTSPNATGSLTFTPTTNATGSATLTVTVNDGQSQNNTLSRTFTLTVSGQNDAPTIASIADQIINEDTATAALAFVIGDLETAASSLTLAATSSNPSVVPVSGVVFGGSGANRTVTVTPLLAQNGSSVITVTVSDASGGAASENFTVTVVPVNDAPTLNAISNLTMSEDAGAQTVNLTGISSGATNESQTVTITATSSNPGLIPNPTISYASPGTAGTLILTPAANASGTATITVTANDSQPLNNTVSRSFTVTVSPVNDTPTLDALSNLTLSEDARTQTIALSGVSSGALNENQTLTVTATSSNPSLIPNPNVSYSSPSTTGALAFTPVHNGNGSAIITITVNDGQSQNNTVSRAFVVTVDPVNDAPTISNIADQSTTQNGATGTIPFVINDVETAASTLTLGANSSNPTLVPSAGIVFGGSSSNRTVKVTPAANQFGSAIVTVTVSDSTGGLASDSFVITVAAVNFPPTLNPLTDLTLFEDAVSQTVALTGISSGATNEAQTLTIVATSSDPSLVPNPTVVYSSPNATGSLSFTPVANAHGSATITVTVSDGQAQNGSIVRSFNVTLNSVNDAPTLNPIANIYLAANTTSDTVGMSGISAGAANEPNNLIVTAISSNPGLIPNPTVNYFSPNTTGSLLLSPVANASGTATITVMVNDGQVQNNSVTRTFTVTVTGGQNNPPTISDVADITTLMNTSPVQRALVIGDTETSAENLAVVASSSNPGLLPTNNVVFSGTGSNRVVQLTANPNQSGFAVVTLTVIDGDGASASDSFILTIYPDNQPPTLDSPPALVIAEDSGPQTVNLTGITAGSPNENQQLVVTASSSDPRVMPHPTVTYASPNTSGTLTLSPASNANGSAVIYISVDDGQTNRNTVLRSFYVTITPVNDPPTVSTIPNQLLDQNTPTAALPFVIGDAEHSPSYLALSAVSSNPTLVPNANITLSGSGANRSITVTPATSQSGTATITIYVSDGLLTASTSFEVTVGAGNTPPQISAVPNQVTDSYTAITNVPVAVSDQESRPEDLILTATSYNQTVLPSTNITFTGTGTNRMMKLKPVAGKSGDVSVSLALSDGRSLTRRSFQVTVQPGSPPKSKISVKKKGGGSVQPNLDGQDLTIGQSYTLTAIPGAGEIFAGWSGSITSSSASVTFVMNTHLSLEATFTNSPYLPMRGTYNGLFHDAAEIRADTSGSFMLAATDRGSYSGKIKLGAKTYPLRGTLGLNCKATNSILRKGFTTLTVELSFGGDEQVAGRVTDGVWESPLLGDRAVFNGKTNPAPYLGNYTLIVPGQDSSDLGPEGDGAASVKVDANGLATLAGTLGDGTKVSQRVALSRQGHWPLHVPLYSGRGGIVSWLAVSNRSGDDINGLLSWIKPTVVKSKQYPGGFTNETVALGSAYVRPLTATDRVLNTTDLQLAFGGGNLDAPFSNSVTLGDKNQFTNLSNNKLTLSVAVASGLFSGTVVDPSSNKTLKFNGALFQKQNAGSGFLLGTNRSGRVVLSQ